MLNQNKLLPVVLCGGSGTRLWPLSRRSFPKQYLSIDPTKDLSFLQDTLIRIKEIQNINDQLYVMKNIDL